MSTIDIQLPKQLEHGIKEFISQGWFTDEGELIREALRRYLDAHESDLMEKFIKEDIEWGINGND
jgi:Arc/MetJ-type ribon-helix-helix transcriptional regulator